MCGGAPDATATPGSVVAPISESAIEEWNDIINLLSAE